MRLVGDGRLLKLLIIFPFSVRGARVDIDSRYYGAVRPIVFQFFFRYCFVISRGYIVRLDIDLRSVGNGRLYKFLIFLPFLVREYWQIYLESRY